MTNKNDANRAEHDDRVDAEGQGMADSASFMQSLFPDQMDPGAETFGAEEPLGNTRDKSR